MAIFGFKNNVVGETTYLNSVIGGSKTQTHAGTLAAIEAVGWRLEHVGYVFVVAEESSRRKLLKEQTAVSGETIGIYLFRNTD